MKSIELPPYAPRLIESTRAMGYSLEAAVADIIDNSITAHAKDIWIDFRFQEMSYISITDNGFGMSEEELTEAMRYGSHDHTTKRDKDDLGRFGLGLKTASLSQCRQLTVISKKDAKIAVRRWDFDHILETGQWQLLILEEDDIADLEHYKILQGLESGTSVLWKKLDRIGENDVNFESSFLDSMSVVSDHVRTTFHRFISKGYLTQQLKIHMNNRLLDAFDPFLSKKSTVLMDTDVLRIGDQKIEVTPYILPRLNQLTKEELVDVGGKDGMRENQGFYIYRNNRLITWGTWFRLLKKGELSKLARVKIDLPNTLDNEWTLDVKKSVVKPPESIKINLKRIIDRISNGSERTFKYHGRKEVSDEHIRVWNRITSREKIFYEVNRENSYISKAISKMISEGVSKLRIENLIKYIEQNLPYKMMHYDFNKDAVKYDEQDQFDEEDEKKLKAFAETAMQNDVSYDDLIEMISVIEPFKENMDKVHAVLGEEYKING